MALAQASRLKGHTAFDAEVEYYRQANASISTCHESDSHRRLVQSAHNQWLARNSPAARVARYHAAHREWCVNHPLQVSDAEEIDVELWMALLLRGDARAYAAVRCRLGIDLLDWSHYVWWTHLDEQDIADLFCLSQAIVRDEEAGARKHRTPNGK